MSWARFDDQFHSHPKLAALPPEIMLQAVGSHLLAVCWSCAYLTDGFLPDAQVRRLLGNDVQPITTSLVAARIWEFAEGGFRIHDFLDYNPSRAAVLKLREKRAGFGRLGGLAKAKQSASKKPSKSVASGAVTRTYQNATPSPSPSPSPSPLNSSNGKNIARPAPRPPINHEAGVHQVLGAYQDAFTATHGEKPNITGKDAALARQLVQRHGVEKVLEVLAAMFASADAFIVASGQTLGVLSSQWNKLVARPSAAAFTPKTAGNAAAVRAFVQQQTERGKVIDHDPDR